MGILLPDNKKLRQIYAYLLLKAFERGVPIVSYEDVTEAVAVAGVTPNKYQVKKYLLIMTNNKPPLIKFHTARLYTIYYRLLIYITDGTDFRQANLDEVSEFRNDISLILSDELTENTLTYATLLRQKIQEKSDGEEG